MALARQALRILQQQRQRTFSSSSSANSSWPPLHTNIISSSGYCRAVSSSAAVAKQEPWGGSEMNINITRKFSSGASNDQSNIKGGSDEKSKGSGTREVTVADQGSPQKKLSKLLPKSLFRRRLWKNRNRDVTPFDLHHIFPSGLGDALLQATNNLNRLFENMAPSRLIGRLKEDDKCYKLTYKVPGLAKEDVKITVEDGFLIIRGEHNEEHQEESSSEEDEEHLSWIGYYNTVLLPDDVKEDEIKAEMKDGILTIIIPKSETDKKDVKEVKID